MSHPPPSLSPDSPSSSESSTPSRSPRQPRKVIRKKRHPCPACDRLFDRPSSLKLHLVTHTGEKAHTCPDCAARFSTSSNKNRHLRICEGPRVLPRRRNQARSKPANPPVPNSARSEAPGVMPSPWQFDQRSHVQSSVVHVKSAVSSLSNWNVYEQISQPRPNPVESFRPFAPNPSVAGITDSCADGAYTIPFAPMTSPNISFGDDAREIPNPTSGSIQTQLFNVTSTAYPSSSYIASTEYANHHRSSTINGEQSSADSLLESSTPNEPSQLEIECFYLSLMSLPQNFEPVVDGSSGFEPEFPSAYDLPGTRHQDLP